MSLNFECTQCGKCCRDLKLPLTVTEALDWLRDGHDVQVLCDAVPWPAEPDPGDQKAAHQRRRSFATMSGSLPTRVVVILAANLAGACPNLQADLRCGIYDRRPLVCRIYPAEINPFVQLDPVNKACPPEAWAADRPLLQRQGRLMDAAVRRDIQQSRDTDARTVEVKRRLCTALHLECAALADEGFVVYSPERPVLLAALGRAVAEPDITDHDAEMADASWRFVSNRSETIDSLSGRGAVGSLMGAGAHPSFEYIGFRPPSA
jgi:Fe-S-cluster containining protein